MKLCNDCGGIACCDFCKYVIEDFVECNGQMISIAPIGCALHTDAEHQATAQGCYFCEDFECKEYKE